MASSDWHDDRLWRPAEPSHLLASLEGVPLGRGRLSVLLGPSNRVGARYFQLRLARGGPDVSGLLAGLHHDGPYPGHNWVEIIASDASPAQEERLFCYLAGLIAPGGHIMVEYESTARRETERALVSGMPPVLTPLGATLLRAGFSAGFKDWYISEGWSEGPRKLQAYRPLDAAHQREKARAMLSEVEAYLATGQGASIPEDRAGQSLSLLRRLTRHLTSQAGCATIRLPTANRPSSRRKETAHVLQKGSRCSPFLANRRLAGRRLRQPDAYCHTHANSYSHTNPDSHADPDTHSYLLRAASVPGQVPVRPEPRVQRL